MKHDISLSSSPRRNNIGIVRCLHTGTYLYSYLYLKAKTYSGATLHHPHLGSMIEVNGRNEATVLITHAGHGVLAVFRRPVEQNTMLLYRLRLPTQAGLTPTPTLTRMQRVRRNTQQLSTDELNETRMQCLVSCAHAA